MLRPTCALVFELAGTDATPATASAIKRSFAYIAPTRVVPAADSSATLSAMHLEVRTANHPLWECGQHESDCNWSDILRPWLENKLVKLMGCVRECNNPTRASYFGGMHLGALTIAISPCAFTFDLEPDGGLRPVGGILDSLRGYLAQNGFANGGVCRIHIPSNASRGDSDWAEVELEGGSAEKVSLA